MPVTIRLATAESYTGVDSRNALELLNLPHLYIPTDDPGVMRSWGVARSDGDGSVVIYERLYPGAIVAARFVGERADRGDLLFHGAELAADHAALLQSSKPGNTALE